MKKLLFASLVLSLVLLVFACNHKDDLGVQNDDSNLQLTETKLPLADSADGTDNEDTEEETVLTLDEESYNADIPLDELMARKFCIYVIVSASGPDCGDWGPNTIICVNCPDNDECPGVDAPGVSRYRLVDADGGLRCKGEWSRSINLYDPGHCINGCLGGGKPGYKFVN
ncbi:MAG: hypothetical protein AAGG75_21825 [Bacteroidota bacterium]